MKKTLIIVLTICAVAVAQELPRIAVYVTGNVGDDEKKALGTRMLATLVNSGRYKGIERSNSFLAEIEKEQVKQRSGAIDDSQISELGRQFGVKFVCIADITPAFGAFQVSARIVNVETAEVEHIGESASPLKTMDDLAQVSNQVVRNMFGEQPAPKSEPTAVSPAKPEPKPKTEIRLSAGGGAFFAGDFGGGVQWPSGKQVAMPYLGGGAYIFFDAKLAEVFAGYSMGGGKWESKAAPDKNNLPDMERAYVNIGVFAKYPFDAGGVRLFPLLGIDYEASVSGKLKYTGGDEYPLDGTGVYPEAGTLSALWFKFGGGVDVGLGDKTYLRAELLYGFRTASAFEKDCVVLYDTEFASTEDAQARQGSGLTLKVGVGVKF